jgi:hypothetical protein
MNRIPHLAAAITSAACLPLYALALPLACLRQSWRLAVLGAVREDLQRLGLVGRKEV